ncbi:restriction endonuclease subunit S [Polaribacter sp. BAL334]|uniref:restriction endonuclease subunit S n=1 Tax=Polaribacter sp. BAL334 TaxID=1708178 RepID=UPI0018D23F5E|nr:restriction endonuclease subunit S [Polaribacter sp. BAL334]MBG7610828.1 restriction endonuclease subunit S [Polaribacter sp. BAL334]
MKFITIDEVATVVRGSSPRPQGDVRYYGGNVPRLMVSDVTRDGMYVTPKIDFLTEEGATKSRPMKKGDFIIAVSGDPGEPCILTVDACIHDGFVGFRNLDVSKVFTPYLYRFFKYNKLKSKSQAVGAIYKNLNTDQIKGIQIPLPSLQQQQKIANILDAADALRQNDKALIAKYDELTQALFLDMFGDPVSNPKGWEKKRVFEISKSLFAGGDVPKDRFSKELNEKYNVPIYSNGLGENALYGFTNINKVKEDSITMSARGTIGFPEIRKTPFFPIIRLIVITPYTEMVLLNYLKIALSFLEFRKGGSSIPQLTVPMIKDKEILIPSIELQNQFAKRVAVIEEQKAIAQKSLEQSESLFNSLLQKAFKGELV